MARTRRSNAGLRVGSPVRAVSPVGAIPEGTRGTIKIVDGLSWTRYWVAWDTGAWTGSVDAGAVVAADGYEAFVAARAEAARRPAVAAVAAGSAAAGDDTGGGAPAGGDGRVPAHLLARSQAARARRAQAG